MSNKFKKYNWVGNKIKDEDMEYLVALRHTTSKTITDLVSEAVSEYVKRDKNEVVDNRDFLLWNGAISAVEI